MKIENVERSRSKVQILNVSIDRDSRSKVVEQLERFIEEGTPRQVVTVNLQFVSEAKRNPEFASIVNGADLAVADGKPLIWVSRILGAQIESRITGHDLLEECAALAHRNNYSIFLLGGADGAVEGAVKRLQQMYPGLRVTGTQHGRFSSTGEAERQDELTEMIKGFDSDILFVALGCPKQEIFINRYMNDLDVPVCIGVGGTFDVFTGRLKRAPMWMQRSGIEWVYRLKQEPGRLWKRYVLGDFPTTMAALASALKYRISPQGRRA